jgi:hypothetical protein
VLAGGVWLEDMAAWLGMTLPIKVLVNQLVVTERMAPVMRTVLGVASGLLSLKQYANGTVLIGGGWQGIGDRARGGLAVRPENFLGNVRLAAHTVPALREARVVRSWLGLEAETADALPAIGPIPGVDDAWIIGSVHSGYTSGPYMGKHPGAGDAGRRRRSCRCSRSTACCAMGATPHALPRHLSLHRAADARGFSPDWEAYAVHTAHCVLRPGIRGVLINGHAGENYVMSRAEKRARSR